MRTGSLEVPPRTLFSSICSRQHFEVSTAWKRNACHIVRFCWFIVNGLSLTDTHLLLKLNIDGKFQLRYAELCVVCKNIYSLCTSYQHFTIHPRLSTPSYDVPKFTGAYDCSSSSQPTECMMHFLYLDLVFLEQKTATTTVKPTKHHDIIRRLPLSSQ